MFAFRFLVSLGLGSIVVGIMLVGGLALFGVFEEEDESEPEAHIVELLTDGERSELAEFLDEDPHEHRLRQFREIPKLDIPKRDVSGFVQLEVTVAPDGTVTDATVIGAAPSGYYEEDALQDVLQRRYTPGPGGPDGEPQILPQRRQRNPFPELDASVGFGDAPRRQPANVIDLLVGLPARRATAWRSN